METKEYDKKDSSIIINKRYLSKHCVVVPSAKENPFVYSYFEKGCRKKCTRQPRKVLWVVLSALFFKEI